MRQDIVLLKLQELVAQLTIGERLPAERQLAHQIGCSRETLRRALFELQRAGRLWRYVGQGTFCGPAPRNLPIRETLLIDGATPSDLLRARLALRPAGAGAADCRRSSSKGRACRYKGVKTAGRMRVYNY